MMDRRGTVQGGGCRCEADGRALVVATVVATGDTQERSLVGAGITWGKGPIRASAKLKEVEQS